MCSCVMFVSMITPVQCGVITDTMPAYTDGFAKGYLFEGVHDWNQCEEALQNLTPAVTFFHVTTYYEVDRGIVLTPSETAKIEAGRYRGQNMGGREYPQYGTGRSRL